MTPGAPAALLLPWIAERLRPLDAAAGPARGSDHDLNAGLDRAGELQSAAVLVGLVERADGVGVLLTRRADTLRRHTGQVAFPGGRADPGETPAQTALREAEEEVGLAPRFVRPLGLGDAYETVTGFLVTPVVAAVRPGFTLALQVEEVAEAFEPPFAWLMDPANHELREAPAPDGRSRRFYAMPWEGRLIWGATAGIIRALRARLFDDLQPT